VPLWHPLFTWFPGARALARFKARRLGRAPVVLVPRARAWRAIAPAFGECLALAVSGVPVHVVLDGRVYRSVPARRLPRALAEGATIYLPQVHQVLPRLMRLMVALRAALLGPFREECSYLFLTEGRGREGMGWHHDGPVDQFWLQLEGRRIVTLAPRVNPRMPEELGPAALARLGAGRRTFELGPGTLFYLPPFTPHRVVCRGRSLALSLTWRRRRARPARRGSRRWAEALIDWDVVSGRAARVPPVSRGRLWTQIPAAPGPLDARREHFPLWLPDGGEIRLPARLRRLAGWLPLMPLWRSPRRRPDAALDVLRAYGLVAPRELPVRIAPAKPRALDGWNFG
jgi:mannose-6-phosphate isomerase-like protein (cupin superfamily)